MHTARAYRLPIVVSVLFHSLVLVVLALGLGGTSAGTAPRTMYVELFETPGGAQALPGEPVRRAPAAKPPTVHPALPTPKESVKPAIEPAPQEIEPVQVPQGLEADEPVEPVETASADDLAYPVAYELASLDIPMGIGGGDGSAEEQLGIETQGTGEPGAGDIGLVPGRELRIGEIRSSIQSSVVYPTIARRRGLEGRVLARFLVDELGKPHDVQVVRSSGYGMFDREVVRVILAASPYPPVDVPVEVPVTFRLQDLASQ